MLPTDSPRHSLPADGGLSTLGLLMQQVGRLTFTVVLIWTVMALFNQKGDVPWPLLILVIPALIRSYTHQRAGGQLVYGATNQPRHGSTPAPVITYLAWSLIQTVVTCGW